MLLDCAGTVVVVLVLFNLFDVTESCLNDWFNEVTLLWDDEREDEPDEFESELDEVVLSE